MTIFGRIPGDFAAVMPVGWAITETEWRGGRFNNLSDWMPASAGMTLDRAAVANAGIAQQRKNIHGDPVTEGRVCAVV